MQIISDSGRYDVFSYRMMRIFLFLFILLNVTRSGAQDEYKKLSGKIEEYGKTRNQSTKAKLAGEISQTYLNYDPDSALYFANELLLLSKTPKEFCSAYSISGIANIYLGEYSKALENTRKTIPYAKQLNDNGSLGNCYNNLGMVFDYMGVYDSAFYYYRLGLEYRMKTGELKSISGSLGNMGLVCYLKGDLNDALKYLFEGLRIAENIGDEVTVASCATNISLVYQKLKNFDKALEYIERAQKIYEKKEWDKDIALGLNNLGTIYLEKKEYKKALGYHYESLRLKEKVSDIQGIAMSYQNIGTILYKTDSLEKAEWYLTRGFAITDSIEDPVTRIEIGSALMGLYLRKKDFVSAKKYAEICIAISEQFPSYVNNYVAFELAADVFKQNGDFKKSLYYTERFHELKDSIENTENDRILFQKEEEHKYEKKKRDDDYKTKQKELKDEAELNRRKFYNYLFAVGILSMVIVLFFVFKNNQQKKRANELLVVRNNLISQQHSEISHQKEIIEEKNKDITDSIQYAKRLQDAILPGDDDLRNMLGAYFVFFRPKDIVSGDFYWAMSLGNDDYLFAVVDCTGHGVPGGFVSIVANNVLNRAVKEFGLKDPAAILNKINELIEENFKHNEGEEIRDGMDLALCRKTGNKLIYSGANNPLWVLKNNSGEMVEIKADKQPIGYYIVRKPFTQHEILLEKGDRIFLFSDGYADQFGGPAGKKFKYAQLKEILSGNRKIKVSELNALLGLKMDSWKGDLEQIDDICVMGIEIG